MKIYIAMVADKHTDTEAFVYTTVEAAIECASTVSEDIVTQGAPDNWLYYGTWDAGESDSWVVESVLDPSWK